VAHRSYVDPLTSSSSNSSSGRRLQQLVDGLGCSSQREIPLRRQTDRNLSNSSGVAGGRGTDNFGPSENCRTIFFWSENVRGPKTRILRKISGKIEI